MLDENIQYKNVFYSKIILKNITNFQRIVDFFWKYNKLYIEVYQNRLQKKICANYFAFFQ